MKKFYLKIASFITLLALPSITFADPGKMTLQDVMVIVVGYFKNFIALIIGLAVLTFVWNVYIYFFTEKDKKEAGLYVLYSTIGFFVILSLWGLVNILSNSFQLNNNVPKWPFGTGSGSSGQQNAPVGIPISR